MEAMAEEVLVQMNASSHETPNHKTSIQSEDIAISKEVVIENPESVVIDKTMVIQKNFIVNEKTVVPKGTVNLPSNQQLPEVRADFFINKVEILAPNVAIQDSQENGKMEIASQESLDSKMEIASQESLDSKMDISSQESDLSPMEYSSQEADAPSSDGSVLRKLPLASKKGNLKNTSHEANLEKENVPIPEKCVVNNLTLKRKADSSLATDTVYDKKEPISVTCVLSREEAVAAREAACISRERAIVKREAAIAELENHLNSATEGDNLPPKRGKFD